jgi:precorrin-3B methylase
MIHPSTPIETAAEALEHLNGLKVELAIAGPAGLLADADYVRDIAEDLEASEEVYVGLAVTEIATLRAELGSPLLG